MKSSALHKRWLIVAATMIAACADTTDSARLVPTAPSFTSIALGPCTELAASGELTFHAYAAGVQIYRWTGTSWLFVAPRATLYADPRRNAVIGSHYAGPTWESVSGSIVVGAVAKRCTPNASAIAWLLLNATSSAGPAVLRGVTQIQRLNTVGGLAPSAPGSVPGDVAEVPYTAEYFFYRSR